MFGGEIRGILTESEKSRLMYLILNRLTVLNMMNMDSAIDDKKYPVFEKETFIFYL